MENNCVFLPQIQSLQDWRNQVTASQDQLVTKTSVSVCESTLGTATSGMETTQQLIDVLEKARYAELNTTAHIFP